MSFPTEPTLWFLTCIESVVGHVYIDAPKGASGQTISASGPSFAINGPVLGVTAARLTSTFTTGDVADNYTVTYSLNGGNSVTMYVKDNQAW